MSDDRINDPDTQIDNAMREIIEEYAQCDADSADINERRAKLRKRAEERGFASAELQEAVRKAKKMSKRKRQQHDANVARLLGLMDGRQQELWPEEFQRTQKREEREAAEKAQQPRTKEELDAATNSNARSDPNAGGAKPELPPDPPAVDNAAEQAAGDAALAAAAPVTAKKQSQSAKAKAKLAAAGLN